MGKREAENDFSVRLAMIEKLLMGLSHLPKQSNELMKNLLADNKKLQKELLAAFGEMAALKNAKAGAPTEDGTESGHGDVSGGETLVICRRVRHLSPRRFVMRNRSW